MVLQSGRMHEAEFNQGTLNLSLYLNQTKECKVDITERYICFTVVARLKGGRNSCEINPYIELVLELETLICPQETHPYLENTLISSGHCNNWGIQ
jgi:hypothetical protein